MTYSRKATYLAEAMIAPLFEYRCWLPSLSIDVRPVDARF